MKTSARSLSLILSAVSLATLAPSMAAADAPSEQITPQPADYTSFNGEKLKLFAWSGKKVAILTRSDGLEPKVMTELCAAFDGIYTFYRDATGRDPSPAKLFDGRLTMAEVKDTCGAACGYLGATGIELTPGVFTQLYSGFESDRAIDQAPPYEFGRNFWFYGAQLAYKKPVSDRSVTTGYAVFMRMAALDATKAKLGPFRDKSGAEFRKIMESLVDLYEADPKLTWENTLKIDAAPQNPLGLNGTDLFASFCLRLMRDHGGLDFVKHLWKEVAKQPAAKTTEDAVDNFVIAASRAAGRDLGAQFADKWRWPVSAEAREKSAAEGHRKQ